MTRLKFVHAADLHLDSPFTGLRTLEPAIAGTLQEATFDAYSNIIELCLSERVDALLIAGDIFDGADRSLRAQLKFVDGLNRLSRAGIRSFICHGNHDPLNGWEARLAFPEGSHRFAAAVEGIPVFTDAPGRAMVHGISYPQREIRESLVPHFTAVNPGPFNIGLLHANVDNDPVHDSYAPCTLADLGAAGIDYWALGHVHTRQVLHGASPTVVYPGNPQGRHPNESGPRGVYIVEVGDAGQVRLEFRAVDVVRWATLEIDVGPLESEQSLIDAIEGEMTRRQEEAEGRSVIFRLALTGRGRLHAWLNRQGVADDLFDMANEMPFQGTPFLWCEKIQLQTAPAIDLQQHRRRSDFVGDLLRLCDESMRNSEILNELQQSLQALYGAGNPGRHLRDHLPSGDELVELLGGAQGICLAELLEEDGS